MTRSTPPAAAAAPSSAYRDPLAASTARIATLEEELARLRDENRALLARLAVPGPLARVDASDLPPEARRRVIQRRIRALRREVRAALGVRRYAASAVVAVTAAAAFIVVAAESAASWPLAIAILCMGGVARGLVGQWPCFEDLEDRRRKLAALKSQLDELREGRRALPSFCEARPANDGPDRDAHADRDAADEPA